MAWTDFIGDAIGLVPLPGADTVGNLVQGAVETVAGGDDGTPCPHIPPSETVRVYTSSAAARRAIDAEIRTGGYNPGLVAELIGSPSTIAEFANGGRDGDCSREDRRLNTVVRQWIAATPGEPVSGLPGWDPQPGPVTDPTTPPSYDGDGLTMNPPLEQTPRPVSQNQFLLIGLFLIALWAFSRQGKK